MSTIPLKETKMSVKPQSEKQPTDDFSRTFAVFKSANDERLAALEAKQNTDQLIKDKMERLNTALDMQQKRLDRLSLNAARPVLTADMLPSESKMAWESYMRTGDESALRELEAKSLSSRDDQGNLIVPAQTQNTIERVLREASPFRTIASVRTISAGLFQKPVSAGGAAAGWAGETEARTQTIAPQLDLVEFPSGELYAMPAATQTLLDDSVADVDQWLAEEVRDVFAAQESMAFVQGDGVGKPRGLLDYPQQAEESHDWGNIGYVITGTEGDFDAVTPIDALVDLIYAPASRYRANAGFVMNRRTLSVVRKFKDPDGQYIWQPAVQAGQPSTLLGYPVTEVEDMPDIGVDTCPVAFGDFQRGYLIVDRQGVEVLRDPYSAKPFVLFYTTKRVGGGVQDFHAIKLLKFSAA